MPVFLTVLIGDEPDLAKPFITTADKEIIRAVIDELVWRLEDKPARRWLPFIPRQPADESAQDDPAS
jgi:hypothetical protein